MKLEALMGMIGTGFRDLGCVKSCNEARLLISQPLTFHFHMNQCLGRLYLYSIYKIEYNIILYLPEVCQ